MNTTQAFVIVENTGIIHFHDGSERLKAERIKSDLDTLSFPKGARHFLPREKYSLNCSLSRLQFRDVRNLLLSPVGQSFTMPRAVVITSTSILLMTEWYLNPNDEIILDTFTSCDNTLVVGIPEGYRQHLAELGITDMNMLGSMLTILRQGKSYEQRSMLDAFYSTYYPWSEAAHIKVQQFRQSLAFKVEDTIKDFYTTTPYRPSYHIENSSSGEIIITVKLPEGLK